MRPAITWYDLLGALPDAPPEDIQQAYDAKASLLRPELLSGAPSKVSIAAAQAQGLSMPRGRCSVIRSADSGTTKRPDCGAAAEAWTSRATSPPVRAAGLQCRC